MLRTSGDRFVGVEETAADANVPSYCGVGGVLRGVRLATPYWPGCEVTEVQQQVCVLSPLSPTAVATGTHRGRSSTYEYMPLTWHDLESRDGSPQLWISSSLHGPRLG